MERVKEIVWMDDKQIEERLCCALDEDIAPSERSVLDKLASNASICAVGEETIKKVKVFERAVAAKCEQKVESVQELEDLVKEYAGSKVLAY